MTDAFQECSQLVADKKYREAISLYKKLVDIDPVRALNNCSACYCAQKEFQEALDVATQALAFDPQHPASHFRAAMAYEGLQHYEEASFHLESALAVRPKDEKYEKALSRVLRQIRTRHGIASEQTKNQNYYNKSVKNGAIAMKEQNFPEAVREFSKAIDLFSLGSSSQNARELAILYSNRSAAYFKKIDFSNSAKDASKACETDPTYSRAFFRLACAKEKLHEYEAAEDAAHSCLALDPFHEEAKLVRDRSTPYAQQSRKTARERAEDEEAELRLLAKEREKDLAVQSDAGLSRGGARKLGQIGNVCCSYCNDVGHRRSECPLLIAKRRRFH